MKLCLIGDRGHVSYVFQSLAEVPEVRIAGVSMGCQDSPSGLLAHCAEAGFRPPVFDDWREMLDKVQPALVCVCGPFESHAEMCAECLRRGIHVFCEKPVAIDLESFAELERVYREERANGARFVSMVGVRYEPAFYTAYGMGQDGTIGRIKLMDARKSYRFGGSRPDEDLRRSGTRTDLYQQRSCVRRCRHRCAGACAGRGCRDIRHHAGDPGCRRQLHGHLYRRGPDH